MAKKVLTQISLIALVLVATLSFTQCKSATDKVMEKAIEAQIEVINAQCPMDMGTLTLEGCSIEGKAMTYNFKLKSTEGLDKEVMDQTAKTIVGTDAQLKSFIEGGYSIVYNYLDNEGENFHTVKVTASDL